MSRLPRLGLAIALVAFMGAGFTRANAQDTGLARGDAAVTGFSGIRPLDTSPPDGADPLDYFFIDLQGPSAEILSLSALGSGPNGQLAPAPVKRQITAGQVGQVFGVALDDGLGQDVPNIYLGATSAYGIQIVGPGSDGQPVRLKTGAPGATFMAGQFGPAPDGTPGTIWRVDGKTGDVSPFAALPGNSGPGIGAIAFDKRTHEFFASDLDNGLIYRISQDGHVLDNFDHGVNGRPANGQPALADDGKAMDIANPSFDSQNPATWGYTQKDRMVWGVAVHDDRVYYAVAGGLQVWSTGINSDGTFAGDARWELDAKALPGDGPITNIVFDGEGRMILAQRGESRGAYDYSVFAEPGKSSVVRYHRETPDDPTTPSVWAPDADEYAIGMRPEYRHADGGIALGYKHDPETGALVPGSCNAMLWSTGSRLRSSENPDAVDDGTGAPDVHGLQGNDAGLVRPQNVPPAQAYYVDYDGLFGDAEKSGHMGDVAIWQPCTGEGFEMRGEQLPGFYEAGGTVVIDFPDPRWHRHTNLRLRKRAIHHCVMRGAGWDCRFSVSIRNTGPNLYFGPLVFSDHMAGLPAGSLVGFAPPQWTCGGTLGNYHCSRPWVFLPVGASTHVIIRVWIPSSALKPGHCRVRNVAHIVKAHGGSVWNTNPADDTDSATAVIPAKECHRPAQRTNLVIRKVSQGCTLTGRDNATCDYRVTVINADPGVYHDVLKVFDQPPAGTTTTFTGAACPPSGSGYMCTFPMVNMGAPVSFYAHVKVPADVARQLGCDIKNTAKIVYAPGGSPENTNPADDSSSATGVVPKLCVPPPVPIVHCPAGYDVVDGACHQRRRPPEQHCPEDTIGEWPHCHRVVPPQHPCPDGMRRRGDHCVPVVRPCPDGMRRRGDHCIPVVRPCPEGTRRRGRHCVPVVHPCPDGMRRRGDHCVPVVRPCPEGTHRRGHRCVPIVRHHCPEGTAGRWPHCRRIGHPQREHPLRRPQRHRPQVMFRHGRSFESHRR